MLKKAALLVVFAVVASACTTATLDATTTTTVPAPADDRLVVATTEGSIVVYDDSFEEIARWDPPERSTFRMPTWLSGNRVVFSEASEIGDHSLIAGDPVTGEVVWQVEMSSSPFYFAPAPAGSPWDTTSLRNDPQGGLIAELVDSDGEVTEMGREAPWYTSWSPDGQSLAVHVPGSRVDIITGDSTETILEPSGGFQAPAWIERGLVLLRDEGTNRFLSIWSDGEFDDIARVQGSAVFVAEGDKIAIRVSGDGEEPSGVQAGLRAQELPTIPADRVVAIDLESGAIDTVTAMTSALFQWDPTGERLLFATADTDGLTWQIWTDGATETLGTYRPNLQWVTDLVPFFDQYAQSVQFWSRDSQRVVLAPHTSGGVFTGEADAWPSNEQSLNAVWISLGP